MTAHTRKIIIYWLLLLSILMTNSGCIGTAIVLTAMYRRRKSNQIQAEVQRQKIEERKMDEQR